MNNPGYTGVKGEEMTQDQARNDVPTIPDITALQKTWPILSVAERYESFRRLPWPVAEEFFLGLEAHDQVDILHDLPRSEQKLWMRLLAPDDAADVIQEASDEAREGLLALLGEPTREEVRALLVYAEDEAGGLMSPRFARVRPEMTRNEALNSLRQLVRNQIETPYYVYVLDRQQRLLGVVSFWELFTAAPDMRVGDLMQTDVVSVTEAQDQESVAAIIAQHDLLAVPVIDDAGRIKGIVTVDDIVDVVQEEATEDIQKLAGMEAFDLPYLQTGLVSMLKKRAGWLMILFIGEMLTAVAMGYYKVEIARAVILALFVPLIISSGGNSGSQAATLVIRALALDEVRARDWWRVFRRECVTGLGLGAILGLIGLGRIWLGQAIFHNYGEHALRLGLTVGGSLIGVVLWGTIAGSMLPLLLRKLGFDPATASTPFVATLVDVTGLIIYFSVASLVLRGTLL
jgi:magnesium transporter